MFCWALDFYRKFMETPRNLPSVRAAVVWRCRSECVAGHRKYLISRENEVGADLKKWVRVRKCSEQGDGAEHRTCYWSCWPNAEETSVWSMILSEKLLQDSVHPQEGTGPTDEHDPLPQNIRKLIPVTPEHSEAFLLLINRIELSSVLNISTFFRNFPRVFPFSDTLFFFSSTFLLICLFINYFAGSDYFIVCRLTCHQSDMMIR